MRQNYLIPITLELRKPFLGFLILFFSLCVSGLQAQANVPLAGSDTDLDGVMDADDIDDDNDDFIDALEFREPDPQICNQNLT